jgi:hypothetical protein
MALTKYLAQMIRSSETMLQRMMIGGEGPFPHLPNLGIVTNNSVTNSGSNSTSSLFDILRDGILWNTPKKRKSLERRHHERFGVQKWGSGRFLKPNRKIRVDFATGEHFELGKLAPKTYEKICQETSEIKSKISDTFGSFNPRNKEASILYEGESVEHGDENKLTVQMEKSRPTFFSRNLTEKTQVPLTDKSNTTVRPTGLG